MVVLKWENMISVSYNNSKILLLLVILTSMVSSCTKDEGPLILIPEEVVVVNPPLVSLSNDIQPIFDQNCISCHNQNDPEVDLRINVVYDQLWTQGFNAPYVDTVAPSQSIYTKD